MRYYFSRTKQVYRTFQIYNIFRSRGRIGDIIAVSIFFSLFPSRINQQCYQNRSSDSISDSTWICKLIDVLQLF